MTQAGQARSLVEEPSAVHTSVSRSVSIGFLVYIRRFLVNVLGQHQLLEDCVVEVQGVREELHRMSIEVLPRLHVEPSLPYIHSSPLQFLHHVVGAAEDEEVEAPAVGHGEVHNAKHLVAKNDN